MSGIKYSIVIPVYNSTDSLVELHKRISKVFEETIRKSFEIIMVDDASPNEKTWTVLEQLQQQDQRVHVFQLMKNVGQHNAIMCGLNNASGDYIITMDDDLQHPPEEIPKLIDAIESSSYDAVFAVPNIRKHKSYRNIGSYFVNKILELVIKKPKDITISSFRAITKDLKEALVKYSGYSVTMGTLICQNTNRMCSIDVSHNARQFGATNYSLWALIKLTIANIFNFSAFPLKFISALGFTSFVFSMIYAGWVIYQKFTGSLSQPGFATIVILIAFFSGLILFSFGVLGQYVIRILRSVTSGRQYIVRKK